MKIFIPTFKGRKHYVLSQESQEVHYDHEKTGVIFSIAYQPQGLPEELNYEDDREEYDILFNIALARPSFFVKEAMLEISALVAHFRLIAKDPLVGTVGEYDPDKFESAWHTANSWVCSVQEKVFQSPEIDQASKPVAFPSDRLNKAWAWNYEVNDLIMSQGQDICIPSVKLFIYRGKPVTGCIWQGAMAAIIPEVDILLIGRQASGTALPELVVFTWKQFQPLLKKHKTKMHKKDAYCLFYSSVPEDMEAIIRKKESVKLSSLKLLTFDRVLDKELVDKAVDEVDKIE